MKDAIPHITRSQFGFRGKYPSLKAACAVPHRSILESHGVVHLEFSWGVKSYCSYQKAEVYCDDSGERICYPDYMLRLLEETTMLVEIKSNKELAVPETKAKYEAITASLAEQGRLYRILTEDHIGHPIRLKNLYTLTYHAPHIAKGDELATWLALIHAAGRTTLGTLEATFRDPRIPKRLIAAGYLWCDLNQLISSEMIVAPTSEGTRWPPLLFEP